MEITLENFREQANAHGICEMANDWDKAKSKKQLVDLALSIRGIEYISKAISEGWGISPNQICQEFSAFNNGKYTYDNGKYTTALYCSEKSEENDVDLIFAEQTALLLVNYVGDIYIPTNHICEIYAVNSKFYLFGDGCTRIHSYGSTKVCNKQDTPTKIIKMYEQRI